MTSRGIIGLVIAAGLAARLTVNGQAPIAPRVNLRADATLVLVPVEVSDQLNRPVSGLGKENFRVFDDGVEQQITAFAMEDEPVAICLVIDLSDSMSRTQRATAEAAQNFFRTANPGDRFCLVTLSTKAELAVPLTDHPAVLEKELMSMKTGGATALLDGIHLAMQEVRKAGTLRKALVIISDGGENSSRYTLSEARDAVRESDTLIYALGRWGTAENSLFRFREVLRVLTQDSGGLLINGTPRQFAEKIVTDLRNRYLLGFSPTDATRDGRLHRLEVKLAPPNGLPQLRAHWKTGYYAATQ